jgi:hypothetical protein
MFGINKIAKLRKIIGISADYAEIPIDMISRGLPQIFKLFFQVVKFFQEFFVFLGWTAPQFRVLGIMGAVRHNPCFDWPNGLPQFEVVGISEQLPLCLIHWKQIYF